MGNKKFNYFAWSKANKELHELYQNTMISEEFKEKDDELTKKIEELKNERRKLRYEETEKENRWVTNELKKAGLL